jgi:hypothetical protein
VDQRDLVGRGQLLGIDHPFFAQPG